MTAPTLEQLHARCRECGECWEWISASASESRRRHPQVHVGGRTLLARRVIFEAGKGRAVAPGRRLVASCGNAYCVNPAHQQELTERQKSRRAAEQGAFSSPMRAAAIARAQRSGVRSKLTAEQVAEIRASSESGPILAAKLGVNRSLIPRIRRGAAWKNYSDPFAGLRA